jgi:hypothetical protein
VGSELHSIVVADTVLIAAPEHLQALKEHGGFGEALAFSDADALKALETIMRDKPAVVALERLFSATSRGAALIKRIKADPSLTGCEIKVVSHDGKLATAKKKKNEAAPATQAAAAAVATPAAPLDQRGTRRAPRFNVVSGVEVIIDGKPATLINVSVVGAQVVSSTILKPNQRVRMILPDSDRPIRFVAGVAWAAFEMPKAGPQYRAGIEFYDAEADNVDKFIDANRVE